MAVGIEMEASGKLTGFASQRWIHRCAAAAVAVGTSMLASWSFALLAAGWTRGLAIYLALVLHEGGHWIAMRRKGIGISWLVFVPFLGGGVIPTVDLRKISPLTSIPIYLAGPVATIPVAVVCLALAVITGQGLYGDFGWIASSLTIFNLLPVGPLDGGRILRAGKRLPESARLESYSAHAAVAGIGCVVGGICSLVGTS